MYHAHVCIMMVCAVWVLRWNESNWHEVYQWGQPIYISSCLKTYLRFPTQLQPAADMLVYEAESCAHQECASAELC